jgi:23S rRNA pseudouridine955/2504/2580 synthase
MTGVQQVPVADDEADVRLDRWFKRHFPDLTHGGLEKLLRTGQIRIDGARAKSNHRMQPGQVVRVPPLGSVSGQGKPRAVVRALSDEDTALIQGMVIYKDKELIALNKPPGLAVQGGSKTTRHIDGMLDALQFDSDERPRLVHRLDRDTSGVLIVARSAQAAAKLGRAFQGHDIEKTYWCLVIGYPQHPAGTISAALAKSGPEGQERMCWDEEKGKKAVTDYRVISTAGEKITWLELMPQTGRTHQLRAHCAIIKAPIVGDKKYTVKHDHPDQEIDLHDGLLADVADQLCLHARELTLNLLGRKPLTVTAPLPKHMSTAFRDLGFSESEARV